MRRGYTREAYLNLIEHIRAMVPDVAISSDFISGFCGETEDDHKDTLSLIETVQFDQVRACVVIMLSLHGIVVLITFFSGHFVNTCYILIKGAGIYCII